MFKVKKVDVFASEIADFLNSKLIGRDFIVKYPSSFNNFKSQSIFYLIQENNFPKERLNNFNDVLILTSIQIDISNDNFSLIISNNPKLDFIKVINEFFIEFDTVEIAHSAIINKESRIGKNVSIGENTIIGPDVSVGNNTKILNNVVISGRVEIGTNCFIKDNSTIGSEGYDFELDEKGVPIHFPHIGKINIGNNVWIGANTSIESASLHDSIIGDFVKIDDLVQIGSNCNIGNHCMITAGVIISYNVKIGNKSWLGPNVSVRENVYIGKNVVVGVGAVVVKNLEDNGIYIGNPAYLLKKK